MTTSSPDAAREACAHLRIAYRTKAMTNGATRGWWDCDLCHLPFVPLAALPHAFLASLSVSCGEPSPGGQRSIEDWKAILDAVPWKADDPLSSEDYIGALATVVHEHTRGQLEVRERTIYDMGVTIDALRALPTPPAPPDLQREVYVENGLVIVRVDLRPGKGVIVCRTFEDVVQALAALRGTTPPQGEPSPWHVLDILTRACEAGAYVGKSSPAVTQARQWLNKNTAEDPTDG